MASGDIILRLRHIRRTIKNGLQWEAMVINQAEMMKRTKCSADPTVDVCAIEVGDLLVQHITAGEKTGVQYMAFGGISKEMFAGNNKIRVEAGDAVLVAGYPKGYYDDVNLFPC